MNKMTADMLNDNYCDFFAVMEQALAPEERQFEILKTDNSNGLSFLRFRSCMQSFTKRNRNARLWPARFMKPMMQTKEILELLRAGGVPGENGHPVPDTGAVTMERILTINPNNLSHIVKQYDWEGDNKVFAIVETLDEGPGSPGYKFMRNILQGIKPAFSTRSIVPQRKNPDGTIDVTGIGRFVCHDRVFVPSHDDAYIDESIPIKNIITKSKFEACMESYVSFVVEKSDKVNIITDGLGAAMESATMDRNGMLSVPIEGGRALLYPENKYRKEFKDFIKTL